MNKDSKQFQPPAYIKKSELSNEDLPHFQWELITPSNEPSRLLADYPMSGARNRNIETARANSLSVILANMTQGNELIIPNFAGVISENNGFSRTVFLDVLNHLKRVALIGREGENFKRSIITYSASRIRRYLPVRVVYRPLTPIKINSKDKSISMVEMNKLVRGNQNKRMKDIWSFYLEHDISPGIDKDTFNLLNDVEVEVFHKPELALPDPKKILPRIVFNDTDLRKGGRMYLAFWIGMKSILRRKVTIDGELTSDIDGKGMHVQLLYRDRNISMPEGDPYLYTDPKKRKIAKGLMLLMMNTKNEMPPDRGRKAVEKTYKKHFGQEDGLEELIFDLEACHQAIFDDLYKPNWGSLQRTEAAIMLSIMERGMQDDVVVLPVHDGCLCPRRHTDRVMGYFSDEGINAEISLKHYQEIPTEEFQEALIAVRKLRQAA